MELYHLPSDPAEQENVATANDGVVTTLDALLQTWLDGHLRGRPDPMQQVVIDGRADRSNPPDPMSTPRGQSYDHNE